MKLRQVKNFRRGVAGILAAVMLFAMLFTVGAGYFLFLNNENFLYTQSLTNKANAIQGQIQENLQIATSAPKNVLALTITNVGGVSVNVSAIIVTSKAGALLGSYTSSNSGTLSPKLPLLLSQGQASATLSTGLGYASGSIYTFRILTQRGTVFTATYPPTATALASQALSSGAIGDLYLNFSSYTWYTITACGSNNCVNNQGQAFTIPWSSTGSGADCIGFSVIVTDLNPSNATITLDQYSHLLQWAFKPGTATQSEATFYVTGVHSTNVLNSTFAPINLPYGTSKLIYFLSANAGSYSCQPASSTKPSGTSPPFIANVFIVSHGWKWLGAMPPTANYGQNMAYVSTLYD